MRAVPNRDLDILVVMDNSTSVLELQIAFREAFPQLLAILDTLDGGRPSLQLGITSTDLGTTGSLAPTSPGPSIGSGPGSCSGLGDNGRLFTGASFQGPFVQDIENSDGTRTTNYAGSLADAFGSATNLGSNGCGFEQPLRAIERALANPANVGFVRSSANFATIVMVDEDDCSVRDAELLSASATDLGPLQSFRCTSQGVECNEDINVPGAKTGCRARRDSRYVDDPQVYVDFLRNLKPDPRMVAVAAIVGPPSIEVELRAPPGGGTPISALKHSCSFSAPSAPVAVADPGLRIDELVVNLHSPNSLVLSVCDSNQRPQHAAIGRSLKKLIGDPCIDTASLADGSADPGVQPSCTAYDETAGTRTELPACSVDASRDCFDLVTDEAACPYVADHLRVRVQRQAPPSADTWTYVRCAI